MLELRPPTFRASWSSLLEDVTGVKRGTVPMFAASQNSNPIAVSEIDFALLGFSGSYVSKVFSCFLFSYFLWNFVTYLHRKYILVSLFFPNIRGLDRYIPSGGVFLYLRLLKLAP